MDDERETATPDTGTESAPPLKGDSITDHLDFYEPGDEQVEATEQQPDPSETDDLEQSEDTTDETQANDEAEGPEVALDDKMVVTLPDGTKMSGKELRDGYLARADYTRNMANLANRNEASRKFHEEARTKATQISEISTRFEGYLNSLVPAEPDIGLLATDPNLYITQKQSREQIAALLENVRTFQNAAQETAKPLDTAELEFIKTDEMHRLAQILPVMRDPGKRDKIISEVKASAVKEFGYTQEQAEKTFDHRSLNMAYWAMRGKQLHAQAQKARAKIQAAPTVAPPKRVGMPQRTDQAAIRRAARESGRIEDIMKMNFD